MEQTTRNGGKNSLGAWSAVPSLSLDRGTSTADQRGVPASTGFAGRNGARQMISAMKDLRNFWIRSSTASKLADARGATGRGTPRPVLCGQASTGLGVPRPLAPNPDAEVFTGPFLRPLFMADWRDVLFVHFRIHPDVLQPQVPLPLDLFEGYAYVSLVSFTQDRLRPIFGGKAAEWISRPLATHEFLNVRTYVRHGDGRGIFFLAEWIPNRLAVLLGLRLYGLPYRFGGLNHSIDSEGLMTREVNCRGKQLRCRATLDDSKIFQTSAAGSEAEFLLERSTAFTCRDRVLRRFRIRHEPWLQASVSVAVERRDLLGDFAPGAPCAAHFSSGVKDVYIGRPERVVLAESGSSPAAPIPACLAVKPLPRRAEFP